MSEDWLLPKSWGEWSLAEFPAWTPEIVRFQSQKFRDYWVARTGAGATKRDWLATWRNWCREARPPFGASAAGAATVNKPPARMSDEERAAANARTTAEAKRLLFGDKTFPEVIDAA